MCRGTRILLIGILFVAAALRSAHAQDKDDAAAWAALKAGGIVLFRHAHAPGGGDPAGMQLSDCTTQRNLDETGRAQARRIGAAFAAQGIAVGRVLTSQWCRAKETAELAFPGRAIFEPVFNSFFDARDREPMQTAAVRAILLAWRGPGALVVTTHHVNIVGLTGIAPASAEGIVLANSGGILAVVGRIQP